METSRISLRNLTYDDAYFMVENLNDEETANNLGTTYPYTIDDAINYIDDALKNKKEKFAIILKETNGFIGVASIHIGNEAVSISLWLTKNLRGYGLGTEVLSLLTKHCFDTLGFETIKISFFDGNSASQKIQEKIGAIVIPGCQPVLVNGTTRIKKQSLLTKTNFKPHIT